jgi:hypothetical protein
MTQCLKGNIILQKPLILKHGTEINAQNVDGYTPLMAAVGHSESDASKHLIEQNARVDLKTRDGQTILYIAVLRSTIAIWGILIETLAARVEEIDVHARHKNGDGLWELFWEARDDCCHTGRADRETEFPLFKELVRTFLGEDFQLERDAHGNWIGCVEEDDDASLDDDCCNGEEDEGGESDFVSEDFSEQTGVKTTLAREER